MSNSNENVNTTANTQGSWKVIAVLMAGIALWGAYHAVGAGLTLAQKEKFFGVASWWKSPAESEAPTSVVDAEPTSAPEKADLRRSLIVAVSSLSFLAFWGVMLYSRQRRLQKTMPKV